MDRSLGFYRDVLGLRDIAAAQFDGERWVFLSAGDSHNDLALVATTGAASPAGPTNLHHVAFEIGGSLVELAQAKSALERAGVPVHAVLDFTVSQALFVTDPDGTLVELYVNTPGAPWREEPSLVANARPLAFST